MRVAGGLLMAREEMRRRWKVVDKRMVGRRMVDCIDEVGKEE